MTIECSNYAKCGNNTGGYINPRLNKVSIIFCSEECSNEVMNRIEEEVKANRERISGG